MSWFGPKLEPGERVVLRSPTLRWQLGFSLPWLLLPVIVWLGIGLIAGPSWQENAAARWILKVQVGLGLVFCLQNFLEYRWLTMVTDRRLLLRRGWLRREVKGIPLDRIDALRTGRHVYGCDVIYGDESIDIDTGEIEVYKLRRALGLPPEPGQIHEKDIHKILAHDEKVVTHEKSGYGTAWWAVTDRRFIHCLPSWGAVEMALADIEQVEQHAFVPRVALRGAGRELIINCFDDEAEKIVRALGREPEEVLV